MDKSCKICNDLISEDDILLEQHFQIHAYCLLYKINEDIEELAIGAEGFDKTPYKLAIAFLETFPDNTTEG